MNFTAIDHTSVIAAQHQADVAAGVRAARLARAARRSTRTEVAQPQRQPSRWWRPTVRLASFAR